MASVAEDDVAERQLREEAGARLRVYVDQQWPRRRGGVRGLCAKAGVGAETIYRWFRGESEPDLGSIRRVAAACDITRAELVALMDGQAGPVDWREEFRDDVREAVRLALAEARAEGALLQPTPPTPPAARRAG